MSAIRIGISQAGAVTDQKLQESLPRRKSLRTAAPVMAAIGALTLIADDFAGF